MLEEGLRRIVELLPPSWTAELTVGEGMVGDALVVLRGPVGVGVTYRVEAKRAAGVSLPETVAALRARQQDTGLPALFVADYSGPATRRALADAGISYVDATGWIRLVSEDPLILLTGEGAERSPRAPESSAVVRLNGLATGRVIRALAEVEVPVGVRELASVARVSPGSVSKLLATLAAEGIVDRDARGAVSNVRRRSLLRRWAQDYGYTTTNPGLGYWLAPRGLGHVTDRLAQQEGVAVTGSAAARRLLPREKTSVVPLRLLALYAPSPRRLAERLGLVEADEATANVVIAAPQDELILP
ncbi:MAG: helix-turn-helix domain-containing protein, partial [Candidatus Nanopelagicales bacterium]